MSNFLRNIKARLSADDVLLTVVAIVAGLFAVAYVLPSGMAALGQANVTDWPTGTSEFITPIGIFVMIGLLLLFARSSTKA